MEIDENLETLTINSWNNQPLELICKGSELSEEIAIKYIQYWFNEMTDELFCRYYKQSDETNLDYQTALESFISAIEAKQYCWLKPDENLFAVIEYSVGGWGDNGNHVGYIQGKDKDDAKNKYQKLHNKTDYDINFFAFDDANFKAFTPSKTLIFEIIT